MTPKHQQATAHKFPCTQCRGDAFVGYTASKEHGDWGGLVKIGERLCSRCFQARGGVVFLGGRRP